MRLNPHLHVVALDGVYVVGPDALPVFRALGRLKTDEVADVVQITKARVLKALERRGVVRVSPEALEVNDAFAAAAGRYGRYRGRCCETRTVRSLMVCFPG